MARLQQAINLDAPQGARPSTDVVSPTDFGLGAVAGQLADYAAAKQKTDDKLDAKAADAALVTARQSYEPEMAARAETYDFAKPGYARGELAHFDQAMAPVIAAEPSPTRRAALQRSVDAYKAQVGDHAINLESAKRAEPLRLQRQAVDSARQADSLIAYNTGFAADQKALLDEYDGSQAGFADQVMAAHDKAAAAALAGATEADRPILAARFAAKRVEVAAQAHEIEQKGAAGFVAKAAKDQGAALANAVMSSPALYDFAVKDLDTVVNAVPASIRDGVRKDLSGQLVEARINGLVQNDGFETAKRELSDGRYDHVLDPKVKERLDARVEAAQTSAEGKKTYDDWLKAQDFEKRAAAEIYARSTTGRSTGTTSLQEAVALLGNRQAAEYSTKLAQADKDFAAIGDVRGQDSAALRARAAAGPPDPSRPDYADALRTWTISQKAASEELADRQKDPAGWALRSAKPGDFGAALQGYWSDFTGAETATAKTQAATRYAANMLGVQARAGVAPGAMRIMPKDQASRLVDAFVKAPPEQRGQALGTIAAIVGAMPAAIKMPDGAIVSARQMAMREMDQAGLGPADLSAVVDLGDPRHAANLTQYVAAANNPAAVKKLEAKGQEPALESAVDARLRPFMQSAVGVPGSAALNAARRSRVLLTARGLVLSQGMSPTQAAKSASVDLVEEYKFSDGMRVPIGAVPDREAERLLRVGVGRVMADLIGGGGDKLRPAPGANGEALPLREGIRKAAQAVHDLGRWVTREDDNGVVLMKATPGGYTPFLDTYNRPVSLTWEQLKAAGKGDAVPWFTPPPESHMPAPAPANTADAIARAVEHHESGGRVDAVSPMGALGVMQLMPGTAKTAAARIGVAFDPAKLTTDAAYNRKLGREELRYLSLRYDGNAALVAAAYNAGPGNVDAWIRKFGDPRRGVSADQWVASIPAAETRDYVAKVLPTALGFLKGH